MVQTTRLFPRSMGRWLMALMLVMLSSLATRAAEAYACYTPSNTTLTFYYDNLRATRPGTTYDLNTGNNDTDWETSGTSYDVTRVVFNSSFANARPTTTYSWFYDMGHLQSITGISYLNTSAVTNMAYMFGLCDNLTSLDVSGFNTANVTKMGGMFGGCSSLTNLDLSNFNTAKVTDMDHMFDDCEGLTTLDLSSFNTTKVTNMAYMFLSCYNLATIFVGSGWTTTAVTSSSEMFSNCTSLVGGQGTTYNANHTDKAYAHIDGGTSNPGYFTDVAPVAYACYTPSNRTLTFYYDNQRSLRTGTTYDLNTGYRIPDWFNDGSYYNVLKVVFATSFAGARPTSTAYWFYCMEELQSITGLKYLNTSEVTNMACMFENCKKLTSIDLSSFNTDNVTTMEYMFHECSSLTSLDLSSFDTSKATSMGDMFSGCTSLTSLDLSSFNTSNVKYMDSMFEYNSNLRTIYVSNGWSTAAVTGSLLMFHDCTSLVGGKGTTYSSSHTDKAYAHIDGGPSNPGYFSEFKEAYACYTPENTTLTFYYDNQRSSRPGTTYDLNTEQNLPGWHYKDITKVVFNPSFADARPTTTYRWFDGFTKLTTITGRNYLNTSEVTDMSDMFKACCALTSLDVSHFDTQKVTNMSGMFYGCSSLTSLNVSNFNTSNVTKMGSMFGDCSGLTSLNVSSFNTSKVTWMSGIFAGCSGLTSLNLSNFNTANVTSMLNMFAYCSSLTSLNVSSFNTSNVTEMGFMFQECSSLTSLNVSSFNTSNVTYMGYMFSGCTRLTSLDLSSFNTSKATYMGEMFYGCSSLTSLDLSSFNTSKVTNMGYMFQDCSSLQTVYVDSSWSTAAVTGSYNMFTNCTNLVGGMGTTYDSSHTDKAYAHIDGGPSNPGYLTEKPAFVRGDVNGDGQVKINDVTALINFLLSHNGTGINLHAADANQSGGITISDVTALINFLLSGRWP